MHTNLIEHFNAEIGLGTINNVPSAKTWLCGTFMYVRLKANPAHYKLEGDTANNVLDERIKSICSKAIALLQEHGLVTADARLCCTEFGDAMARYYLDFESMKVILALPPKPKISEIVSSLLIKRHQSAQPNRTSSRRWPKPTNSESSVFAKARSRSTRKSTNRHQFAT